MAPCLFSLLLVARAILEFVTDGLPGHLIFLVEDEVLPELVDNPGTRRYEIVCLAKNNLSIFAQSWLLTADPLMRIRRFRKACLVIGWTALRS